MRNLLRYTIALCLLASSAFAAQIPLPSPLSALVASADDFVVVGDLTFDSFSYVATGDMPPAADINVLEWSDSEGNAGLRFQGGFVDAAAGGASDALIGFSVVSSGAPISDAHLSANPDVLGGTAGTGLGSITETFLPEVSNDSLSVFDNGTVEQLSDSIVFNAPVGSLNVQKDILLLSAQGGAGATISFVDQTFTQTPEPAAFASLLVGLIGLGTLRRRR